MSKSSRPLRQQGANASDVLVAPAFRRWAARGGVISDPASCPTDFLPFVQSFDFSLLVAALQKRPRLYFHPAVQAQVGHLLRLRDDEDAWLEVWEVHVDPIRGIATPAEVERVEEVLDQLLSAHVNALLPSKVIAPRHVRKKPGERGGFENPHPTHDAVVWISPSRLYASWRPLRSGFESPFANRLLRAMPLQPPAEYVRDVVALVHDVIDDEPPLWSALIKRVVAAEPPGR